MYFLEGFHFIRFCPVVMTEITVLAHTSKVKELHVLYKLNDFKRTFLSHFARKIYCWVEIEFLCFQMPDLLVGTVH